VGAKEESTLQGERLHFKHLLKHLRGSVIAQSLSVPDIQGYVTKRSKDRWRGKPISSQTVKKELTTLRLVYNWAIEHGYLTGPSPVRGIKYAKPDEKPIFRTHTEIERILKRGGISADEEAALWESLYLTRDEVKELLEYVKCHARHPFVYPLFVLVAHTGCRRSEALRTRIDDFDFGSATVQIREKKKSRQLAMTYRRVDMTNLLASTMRDWFDDHRGGQFAITADGRDAISIHEAHDHFKRTLSNSKWSRLRGYHVLRHSFCSNMCAAGVDQRIIDGFVGHTTEAMRKRYQHLAPALTRSAIERLCL
jgi:integrase